jgi:broad specificity polyphosphatase/5'/3'-nucleotidase SurE
MKIMIEESEFEKLRKLVRAARYLAQKANLVTAPHRHKSGVASNESLDALSNAQIAYEEAEAECLAEKMGRL